jgi:hypothetical protein
MLASVQHWTHGNRAMYKASSRHPDFINTFKESSSSPCWMHEVDPGYFGYWSNAEVIVFLKDLLERERIGSKAFENIRHSADLRVAELMLEAELNQALICILLRKEISKKGAMARATLKTNEVRLDLSFEQAVASATSNLVELCQTIEAAILNILDAGLNSLLMKILRLHRKQIEQLKILLAQGVLRHSRPASAHPAAGDRPHPGDDAENPAATIA